jgi:hypothetical protein
MTFTQPLPKSLTALKRTATILACVVLFLSPDALGKDTKKPKESYGLIFGTVWGPDNQPVFGVRVRIRRATGKKARWEVYSDHNGEFAQRVPAEKGDYVIWVDAKDLKSIKNNKLNPGEPVPAHLEFDERVDIGVHLIR